MTVAPWLIMSRCWHTKVEGVRLFGGRGLEGAGELKPLPVALDPWELAASGFHPGSTPAQRHRPVAPAFDVGGAVANQVDHGLDAFGRGHRPEQRGGDSQPRQGTSLVEPLGQRACSAGVLAGQGRASG